MGNVVMIDQFFISMVEDGVSDSMDYTESESVEEEISKESGRRAREEYGDSHREAKRIKYTHIENIDENIDDGDRVFEINKVLLPGHVCSRKDRQIEREKNRKLDLLCYEKLPIKRIRKPSKRYSPSKYVQSHSDEDDEDEPDDYFRGYTSSSRREKHKREKRFHHIEKEEDSRDHEEIRSKPTKPLN